MATRLRLVAALHLGVYLVAGAPASAMPGLPDFCVDPGVIGEAYKYYQARADGSYCDGIVFEAQGAEPRRPMPVLAVATGVAGEVMSEETVAVLATSQELPIRVQGVALDSDLNYRLDAVLTTGTQLRVGPESGLYSIPELSLSEIGWSAWVDSPSGLRYLPTLDQRLGTEEVMITVRPELHAASVVYVVEDGSGHVLVPPTQTARDVKAGDEVRFSVPGRGPSPIRVQVVALGKAGGRQTARLTIERRNSDDGG